MTTITTARAIPADSRLSRLRKQAVALAKRGQQFATDVRARYESSAMTVAGLAFIDVAAWQVDTGLGWLVLGVSTLLYDAFGREKPLPGPGEKP